jgi:3-hydroxyacyl-[acyl-carrier-protein] dehydratase|tara:strand:- start:29 stop:496 length:468 start_codon:yes stop_codon:yes gene_type:complete
MLDKKKSLILDKKLILEFQKNKPPYLMIDEATEIIPGISAKGYKYLDEDEWFFKVHWEGDPNMPGMLQIEALVQMSALSILTLPGNKGKVMYLVNANNLKFFKKVLPKSKYIIETVVKSYKRGIALCEGKAYVENEIVSKAEFSLALLEELKIYK